MSASITSGSERSSGAYAYRIAAVLAASILALEAVLRATPAPAPKRLAIYYGFPSLVEGAAGDLGRAADTFVRYDVVVFGDGLALGDASRDAGLREEHHRLARLVPMLRGRAPRPLLYGYVDLGRTQQLSEAEIGRRVEAWRRLGVDGIFYDEAGSDFGVTRARRTAAVAAVHARGLSAFMNAFNPDDLFESAGLGARDALLVESFAVRDGIVQAPDAIAARMASAVRWRRQTGVKVYAVTTSSARTPFDRAAFDYARRLAKEYRLDGFGWGEPDYGANAKLPWRWGAEDAAER